MEYESSGFSKTGVREMQDGSQRAAAFRDMPKQPET